MAKITEQPGYGRILDAWNAPADGGEPVGCISTTFTFNPIFFETECLGRFLGLESDADDDKLQFLIEQETRMAQLEAAVVLVDQHHCVGKRSLRWDLLSARLAGRLMHAKVSVLAWGKAIRVIIGSANLTEDGYRRNQEIFGVVDFNEGCEAPRELLSSVIHFLEALFETSILDSDRSPACARCRALLKRLAQISSTWGIPGLDKKSFPPEVYPVFSGLGEQSVLKQLSNLWPSSTPPSEAWVISPFFDVCQKGADAPTTALWSLLRKRGDAEVAFCVTAEPIPGEEGILVHAPESLLRAQPAGRPSVRTTFHRIEDKDNRVLHTKAIWLEGDRYALYLIGSSNFTTHGLNLSTVGHVEANLAYISDYQQHEKEARRLENCFPVTEPLDPHLIQWRGALAAEEEAPAEATPLPLAFGRAVYDASTASKGQLTLHFRDAPLPGWRVISEHGTLVLAPSDWDTGGRPRTEVLPWPSDRPPSGLWVQWPATNVRSWWPVEVLSREALLAPDELRNLPLETLIRVLTSAQPLHRVLATEIRRKREAEEHHAACAAIADPHKKVDVSGFLLQRSRRIGDAIEALCNRLKKPASSEACLHWKIHGPVGVKSLMQALANESKSTEERAFLLTELALALAQIKLEPASGVVPESAVRRKIGEAITEIRAAVPPGQLTQVPNLSRYIERAFAEIAL